MTFNPDIHHRKSIRLRGYDYSQAGLYFVTICTQGRQCLFGYVDNGVMNLNDAGKMLSATWGEIPAHYEGVEIDEFVVMPNHIHGIVTLVGATPRGCPDVNFSPGDEGQARGEQGQARGPAPTQFRRDVHTRLSLPDVVHRFKTMTTKRYANGVKQNGWQPFSAKLWQRNYYEHIIRDEAAHLKIAEYIQTNPQRWQEDTYYV